jgi:hypothetical protein
MMHLPTSRDPPPTEAGALVLLDRHGKLQRLTAIVAPGTDLPPSAAPPDWSGLFDAAGLRLADFDPVEPSRVAPVSADARAAWIEKGSEDLATRTRVEAAALAARPVHFEVVSPHPRTRSFTAVPIGRLVMLSIVVLTLIAAAALLARRNTRLGRSDTRGAFRLAAFSFSLCVPIYLFGTHHVPGVEEVRQLFKVAITQLAWAATFWLAYVAIEPFVRRRWPDLIVSSTRLLAGRVRDPLIGRDILIGGLLGTAAAVFNATYLLASISLELPRHTLPPPFVLGPLYSAAQAVGQFAWIVQIALQNALGVMLLLVVLTSVLRRRRLTIAAFFLLCIVLMGVPSGMAPPVLVQALLATLVVTRHGILAGVAYTLFFLSSIWFPLTLDPDAFYVTSSAIVIALLLGVGWWALYTTLAGKPLGGWTESPSV